MPMNIFPAVGGLFQFFQRYGIGTVEEIIEIILGGFTTETTGAYNPVNFPNRWKNVKDAPYKTEQFEFSYGHHLNIISEKERNKKFRLSIVKDFDFINKNPINILYNMTSKGFTQLGVIKSCLTKEKLNKLHILSKITGENTETININTNLKTDIYTPIIVKTWIKKNILTKLGVLLSVDDNISTKVSDGSYLYDDIGSISDIEMIEIVGDINAIRH
jgi:hypothetical protein